MDTKSITLGKVKAGPEAGLKDGQMIAYASIFGNVDSYGDIVAKGAFKSTLAWWKKSGRQIPLLYGHDMDDPHKNIGVVLDAVEDERGLKITAQFDDDETAQKVYRLVKSGRIAELSFAFDTLKYALVDDPDRPDAWRELQELKLYECSVVPIGANSETEVLAVKAGIQATRRLVDVTAAKAGRVLSKDNENSIKAAMERLDEAAGYLAKVLPADEDPDDTDEDEDEGDKAAGTVPSDHGVTSSTDPAPAPEVLKSAVLEVLQGLGITAPSDGPAALSAEVLVREVEILGLGPA